MSRRSKLLLPHGRDGTSQGSRRPAALDPSYALIDERTNADVLRFVQKYTAEQLRFFEVDAGTGKLGAVGAWENFALNDEIPVEDIEAYLADPGRFTGEKARWLGRPHFALLLTFVELLGRAREHLNGFTRRHLDYHFRELLKMTRQTPIADRATVLFTLRPGATEARLPAGTELQAGRDSKGKPRIYRTEREIVVNRAEVASLRSVFVDWRITGISDVRANYTLPDDSAKVLEEMLKIAIGKQPGEPVAQWNNQEVNFAFINELDGPLDFAWDSLHLKHHELRSLMRLVRWCKANGGNPALEDRLDAAWGEINRLVEAAGRRQWRVLEWTLPPKAEPRDFEVNLALALQWPKPPERPALQWPWGVTDIDAYEAELRKLEAHLSMSVERLQRLASSAKAIARKEEPDWGEVERILSAAHVEKVSAARRAKLVEVRAGGGGPDAFDAVASFVLGEPAPISWDTASQRLAVYLDQVKLDLLSRFREGLESSSPLAGFDWPDADRFFEIAWSRVEGRSEPVAEKVDLRNIYAYEDATAVRDGASASPGWKIFGRRPPDVDPEHPLGATIGWALRSPLLSLSEGKRTITLTLRFPSGGFDLILAKLLEALQLSPSELSGHNLTAALEQALALEVSTVKGWIKPGLAAAQLVTEPPTLQLQTIVDASCDALAPLKGSTDSWPSLRLVLQPRWNEAAREWQTLMQVFEPLVLQAVHLQVEVQGLSALRLQQDDRLIDPRKPFEPFGSRPAVGARLYIEHPELVRSRLEDLRFDVEWMGLPESLERHYFNYPGIAASSVFKVQVSLVDSNVELDLGSYALFEDTNNKTSRTMALTVRNLPRLIEAVAPGHMYANRNDLPPANDVRLARRYFRWELDPVDFGHAVHATLVAAKARELAVAIAAGKLTDPAAAAAYQVDSPYTPTIKRLTASYSTSVELDPRKVDHDHTILHVHPFGASAIDTALPSLLPRYDDAGELYIGLRDLQPPHNLALLMRLDEGTSSDPDAEGPVVRWSYLAGDRFEGLTGSVVEDSTLGLINSGIIELSLPAATVTGRLPRDLYWLQVAIPRDPSRVCDAVAVRPQAVSVRFDDRGNASGHYEQPLPAGAIDRLVEPNARIGKIEQPFRSFGGKPGEKPEVLDTRVSERLRHKQRALSAWDYERLVLQQFTQISKAKCIPAAGGVDVIVVPDLREFHSGNIFEPKAPANLLAQIQSYLSERAPSAARIRVRNAQYVPVQVRLGVRFQKRTDERYARQQINEDLVRFLSPWAFDEKAEPVIGGRIYAISILDYVDRLDYVDYVTDLELFRSEAGKFGLVPRPAAGDYHVAPRQQDQVLVAAQQHYIDVIPESGYQQSSFIGINYMRIGLDFIVS